ncbi:MAG TPA: FG-GAP-like repeat-containing protein [Terriglobia bacterium]|nr:FG-GAP-like repeat-containing protein [Terriglobia bacterium]
MRTQEGSWHWNVQYILGIAVTCGLLWVSSVSASAQTYLYNRADFPTGNSPSAVVTADLNGDGIPDLAVVNQSDNTVSVLLGKPDGTFTRHVDYVTGHSPLGLVAADFNGDGKLDLAVVGLECIGSPCTMSGTVSILLGNGDGTFQPHTDYSFGNGQSGFISGTTAIVAADFNGDGKTDIAVLDSFENLVAVLFGNGDGTLQGQQTFPVGNMPTALAVADFNGDGKPDLITANVGNATVSVLLNDGGGTFTRKDSALPDMPAYAGFDALAVGDFNSDGRLDAVATNTTGQQLFFLEGNGDGTFATVTTALVCPSPSACSALSLPNAIQYILAMDLNHDGKVDLTVATNAADGLVAVLLGNGDGTFQQPVLSALGVSATSIALADINGDGQFDLVGTDSQFNSADVLLGTDIGTFGAISSVDLGTNVYEPAAAVAADFNGDGKLDLAVAEPGAPNGQIGVELGNGDGTFRGPIYSPLITEAFNTNLMLAGDFNGDGKPDLVVLDSYGAGFEVLLGNGDGTFQAPIDTALPANSAFQGFAAGDFNGDSKSDLAVVTNGTGSNPLLTIYLSNGDGSFHVGAQYPVSVYSKVIATDFNHDGKLDLAVTSSGGALQVFLGNGDGTFSRPITGQSITYNGVPIAIDANGDGKIDLVVGTYQGVAFLAGNGDGTFQNPIYSDLSFQWGSFVTGDFNGDGKLDLVGAAPGNVVANGAAVLLGNGDGTFQSPQPFGFPGAFTSGTVTGDFNSDGISDLALPYQAFSGPSVATLYLSAPVAAVCPGSLNASPGLVCASGLTFPNNIVGLTSDDSHDVVVLSNSGNAPLKITSISATGDFSADSGECTTLAIGAGCENRVNFSPTAEGTRTGKLIITDNATPSPQTVSLTGVGVAPVASLSVSSLNFSSQSLGTTSSTQSVVLTNKGNASLNIVGIGNGGDFAQTYNNCGSSVAIGASCTISVTFTPTAVGPRSATLTIQDNAPGSPQSVALTGTGLSAAVVNLSATSLNLGSEIVGGTTAAQSVTLKNTGTAALGITSITAGGDFSATNNCGASVAAGGSCTISITFKPSAGGSRTGSIAITDNAPSSPQTVALLGSGQDFSFSVPSGTPTSASISPGGTATYSINIAGVGGLNGAVTFSCVGAPSESTCSVSPSSLTPGSTASVLTVTVTTVAPSTLAPLAPPRSGKGWRLLALGLSVLLLVVFGWPARHRPSSIALWRRCLALSAALMLILGMAACGGGGGGSSGGGGNPGTPAGAYTLTVSGSVTEASTTVTHNMSLTLNVQ